MSVRIETSRTISGDTFYKNKDFDISFSFTSAFPVDASLSFRNSTYGVLPYANNTTYRFRADSNTIGTAGPLGILRADVLDRDPRYVRSVTAPVYAGTSGLATGPSGTVYVAVADEHSIFTLDPSTGTMTLFAGTRAAGDADGARLEAEFRSPLSVAADGSGNVYVTDRYRLRKIDASGVVSTLAGSTTQGYVNGTGAAAQFQLPTWCLPRPSGDIFVTDSDSHAIRNVTQAGVVTTYAGGGGQGYSDGLRRPETSVTSFPSSIRAAGGVLYDTSTTGTAWTSNSFSRTFPAAACLSDLSSGLILYGAYDWTSAIAYQTNARSDISDAVTPLSSVFELATDGSGTYVAGGYDATEPDTSPMYSSNGITWDVEPTPGDNRLAFCYTVAYGNGTWMAGGAGSNGTTFNLLLSTNGSNWTRTDTCLIATIRRLAYADGKWVAAGDEGAGFAYSTDSGTSWVPKLDLVPPTYFRHLAYGAGRWVIGDNTSNLYSAPSSDVLSWSSATGATLASGIRALYYSTLYSTFIATGSNAEVITSTDGMVWTARTSLPAAVNAFADISQAFSVETIVTPAAQFSFPAGLALDATETLYIADAYNNRIRTVSNDTVSTYAGSGTDGATFGTRTSASIGRPTGLTRTSNGTFYITSVDRQTLQSLSGNTVSLLAGQWNVPGFVDGRASNARFWSPGAVTTRETSVYIGEAYNGVVREYRELPAVSLAPTPAGETIIGASTYPITINSRIDVCWTSVGGLLPLYKFEPFDASFTANRCGGTTNDVLTYTATTSTELLGYMSGTGTSNVLFRGSNGPSVAYPYPLTLSVRAISNVGSVQTVVDDVSTTVTIGAGRIVYSPCNATLTFYRNEPISPVVFSLVASDVSLLYSATTLPTGLSFTRTDARSFTLAGTPTLQSIGSNYTILASDTRSRTYATQVSMGVNPERLLLDVSGSLTQSNVLDTEPIQPITFTARFPPYGIARSMRYTWSPPPPLGLEFRDPSGAAIAGSSYTVTDTSSFPLTLSGTISRSYLRTLALNNMSNSTLTLTGVRTSPLPTLSPSLPLTITLRYGETIFFPQSNVPPLFVGLPVSNYVYTAKTYFATLDTSIEDIAVTDGFLPDGLDGSFTFIKQQFALSGTPTTAATYPFTLTATNGNELTASLSVAPIISNDFITLTALDGDSFRFIQSRDLSNAKPGFYPSPIRYSVSSGSGNSVTLTGTNLPAGVTLVSNAGTYRLAGRPTTATGSSVATLTAQVPATGVSATKTFTYSVSAEEFVFPSPTFAFVQNVPISPVQIDVTTLSENSVIRFSSPNIPAALQITNTGLISGTPQGGTSGTFDVTAFTAYSSGTKTYSYTTTPDQVLLQPAVYTTVTAPGCNVSIPINGYSLSATTVSNYRFQSVFPYGLAVNPTTGLLSGTLASSLPDTTPFTILGSAGSVNGSLTGTMTTANLTTSRAQVIEIQSQSNLRVYFSDDIGVNWSSAYASNGVVAGRVGVNNVDTYLIPTSSDIVLRSSTGSNYTPVSLGQSALSPLMTGVTYDSSSSTWWVGGTLSNGTRSVRVFKSSNDGATWDAGTTVPGLQDRSGNADPAVGVYDAYLYGGVDLAQRGGVLLAGGRQIARSTDSGATWTTSSSSLIEVARFSLDQGEVWVAVGSSLYSSTTDNTYTGDATTIVYSLDQGLTWTNAPTGFNMNAYEIVYGEGVWLASGLDWTGSAFVGRIRYSFDALNWTILTSIPSFTYATTLDVRPPGVHGAIGYDQGSWSILYSPEDATVTRYSNPGTNPIDAGWTTTTGTDEFPGIGVGSRFSSYVVQTIDPGADVTTITFPPPTTGPTFVSPSQTTYVVWQYMPIPAITFAATGTAPISYFVSALPVGLSWNSTTHSVSGTCMRTGTQSFTVYAVDGTNGVTVFTVTLICDIPRIVKKQTGAGAYTALVRDYTEVAAAIHARDTRVNPREEAALGSFAAPYAPDVVTPSNCPC